MKGLLVYLTLIVISISFNSVANILPAGHGSYSTRILNPDRDKLPSTRDTGAALPKQKTRADLNVTCDFPTAVPTNSWLGGVVWHGKNVSDQQMPIYPLPLGLQFMQDPLGLIGGLHITKPAKETLVQKEEAGFNAGHYQASHLQSASNFDMTFMPAGYDNMQLAKEDAWSADLRMSGSDSDHYIQVGIAHGSPYVNLDLSHDVKAKPIFKFFPRAGLPVSLPSPEDNWFFVKVNNNVYGFFAAPGAQWSLEPTNELLVTLPEGKPYISMAVLPNDNSETRQLFGEHAGAWLQDTHVTWHYDEASSQVSTHFSATVKHPFADSTVAPLMAAYPHQYRDGAMSGVDLTGDRYAGTVRGTLLTFIPKANGADYTFSTKYHYPGILSALPLGTLSDAQREKLASFIAEYQGVDGNFTVPYSDASNTFDTYWAGKRLNKMVQVLAIIEDLAKQTSDSEQKAKYETMAKNILNATKDMLQRFFSVNEQGHDKYFYYDNDYNIMVGYPSGYGSGTHFNDHHFHYGYFIYAAAQVALRDKQWTENYAPMVNLIIKDLAANADIIDKTDPLFPAMRYFDAYEGHSWASGDSISSLGPNQESASEAMNAWAGIILWGSAINNTAIRDTGIYLYTTELQAINNYWFDLKGDVLDKDFTDINGENAAPYATMILGGGYQMGTFFGVYPVYEQMINALPLTASALYLGMDSTYAKANYDKLIVKEGDKESIVNWTSNGDWQIYYQPWEWQSIIQGYQALFDATAAEKSFDYWRMVKGFQAESGDSNVHTYGWIVALQDLGQPVFDVTADTALYAVFAKADGSRSYVAENTTDAPISVTFRLSGVMSCQMKIPAQTMKVLNQCQ